jgi:DNA-binding CsgD family transcriptional regulator
MTADGDHRYATDTGHAAPARPDSPPVAGGSLLSSIDDWTRHLPLSHRECEISRLVARDFSNKRIARTLGISVFTVSTHLRRIFLKLDVHTKAGMVARVLDELARERASAHEIGPPPLEPGDAKSPAVPAAAVPAAAGPVRESQPPTADPVGATAGRGRWLASVRSAFSSRLDMTARRTPDPSDPAFSVRGGPAGVTADCPKCITVGASRDDAGAS